MLLYRGMTTYDFIIYEQKRQRDLEAQRMQEEFQRQQQQQKDQQQVPDNDDIEEAPVETVEDAGAGGEIVGVSSIELTPARM